MTDLENVYKFLAQRRIALVGLSQKPKHFSRTLFRELIDRKYNVCPVNPNADQIDGFQCHRSIADVMQVDYGEYPVGGAIIMTSPKKYRELTEQCIDAGVKRIWLYGIGGNQKKYADLDEKCRANDIVLIADLCPFMFLPQTALIHRFHGGILKIFGKYPK